MNGKNILDEHKHCLVDVSVYFCLGGKTCLYVVSQSWTSKLAKGTQVVTCCLAGKTCVSVCQPKLPSKRRKLQ